MTYHDVGIVGEELDYLFEAVEEAGETLEHELGRVTVSTARLTLNLPDDEAGELKEGDKKRSERDRAEMLRDQTLERDGERHARSEHVDGTLDGREVPEADRSRNQQSFAAQNKVSEPEYT